MKYFDLSYEAVNFLGQFGQHLNATTSETVELVSEFLRPICVVFLDQQFRTQSRPKSLYLSNPTVNTYLRDAGFEFLAPNAPTHFSPFDRRRRTGLKAFTNRRDDEIVLAWVREQVMVHFPNFTSELERDMVKKVYEIVHNGMVHSHSSHGVSVFGQLFPQKKTFEIAFYDAGVGIPQNVRNYGERIDSDAGCIEWALRSGTTTRPSKESGGMGLFLLQKFLGINNGFLQIASGNGYYERQGNQEPQCKALQHFLHGTLVSIKVRQTSLSYSYKHQS
ncbi:MAG: hypothetical protein MUF71_15820 [Candidatus Kapabacteria bacterium]|jgi:anti-sigma regulatory factor (Ser/Thr protein kinase)|nr:hypothetical protein [Candidatus Kapabacteria bacterium]